MEKFWVTSVRWLLTGFSSAQQPGQAQAAPQLPAVALNRTRRPFFASLESLRGLAALNIVIFHATWTNPVGALQVFRNAPLMVDIFFVLSGFVIAYNYLTRILAAADAGRFMWLRFWRLYPLHLLMLMTFVVIQCIKYVTSERFNIASHYFNIATAANNLHTFWSNVFLVHGLGLDHSLSYNYPSWSISTEFYAYALFAIVVLGVGRGMRLIASSVCIIALSALILIHSDKTFLGDATYDLGFVRCAGGFFLGVLTCLAARRIEQARKIEVSERSTARWLCPAILLGTGIALSLPLPAYWSYLVPVLTSALILTIVVWPNAQLDRLLGSRPLLWLGRISYSTYMIHAAIAWVIAELLTKLWNLPTVAGDRDTVATSSQLGLVILLVYVTAVLLTSQLTYRWVESQFREWSRRRAREFSRDSKGEAARITIS